MKSKAISSKRTLEELPQDIEEAQEDIDRLTELGYTPMSAEEIEEWVGERLEGDNQVKQLPTHTSRFSGRKRLARQVRGVVGKSVSTEEELREVLDKAFEATQIVAQIDVGTTGQLFVYIPTRHYHGEANPFGKRKEDMQILADWLEEVGGIDNIERRLNGFIPMLLVPGVSTPGEHGKRLGSRRLVTKQVGDLNTLHSLVQQASITLDPRDITVAADYLQDYYPDALTLPKLCHLLNIDPNQDMGEVARYRITEDPAYPDEVKMVAAVQGIVEELSRRQQTNIVVRGSNKQVTKAMSQATLEGLLARCLAEEGMEGELTYYGEHWAIIGGPNTFTDDIEETRGTVYGIGDWLEENGVSPADLIRGDVGVFPAILIPKEEGEDKIMRIRGVSGKAVTKSLKLDTALMDELINANDIGQLYDHLLDQGYEVPTRLYIDEMVWIYNPHVSNEGRAGKWKIVGFGVDPTNPKDLDVDLTYKTRSGELFTTAKLSQLRKVGQDKAASTKVTKSLGNQTILRALIQQAGDTLNQADVQVATDYLEEFYPNTTYPDLLMLAGVDDLSVEERTAGVRWIYRREPASPNAKLIAGVYLTWNALQHRKGKSSFTPAFQDRLDKQSTTQVRKSLSPTDLRQLYEAVSAVSPDDISELMVICDALEDAGHPYSQPFRGYVNDYARYVEQGLSSKITESEHIWDDYIEANQLTGEARDEAWRNFWYTYGGLDWALKNAQRWLWNKIPDHEGLTPVRKELGNSVTKALSNQDLLDLLTNFDVDDTSELLIFADALEEEGYPDADSFREAAFRHDQVMERGIGTGDNLRAYRQTRGQLSVRMAAVENWLCSRAADDPGDPGEVDKEIAKSNKSKQHIESPEVSVIMGNPAQPDDPEDKEWTGTIADFSPEYQQFYMDVVNYIKNRGYTVALDPGLEYEDDPLGTIAWIGHSRGVSRLRFAEDAGVEALVLDDYEPEETRRQQEEEYERLFEELGVDTIADVPMNLRPVSGPEHYAFNDDMKAAIDQLLPIRDSEDEGIDKQLDTTELAESTLYPQRTQDVDEEVEEEDTNEDTDGDEWPRESRVVEKGTVEDLRSLLINAGKPDSQEADVDIATDYVEDNYPHITTWSKLWAEAIKTIELLVTDQSTLVAISRGAYLVWTNLAERSGGSADVPMTFAPALPNTTKGLQDEVEAPHQFSCVMVEVPLGDVARKLFWMQDDISEEDLTDEGKEDRLHITVLYGLHTTEPDEIAELVQGFGPIKVRLGRTSLFSNEDADVVKVEVESPDLARLHTLLTTLEHTSTHPHYRPHITLAYVIANGGSKYQGWEQVEGQELTLDTLLFSTPSGDESEISLL